MVAYVSGIIQRHPAPGSTWDGRYLTCWCWRGSAGHEPIAGRRGWFVAR